MVRESQPGEAAEALLTREVFGNVSEFSQRIFYGLAAVAVLIFCYGIYRRVKLWRLGQKSSDFTMQGVAGRVVGNVLLLRRMITRPTASTAHRLLFGGFVVLFIGTLLIAVEHLLADLLGRSPSNPVFHKGLYFAIYEVTLDLFGVALLAGCIMFMWRRWRGEASIARTGADWMVLTAFLLIGVTGYLIEGLRILYAQTPMPGLSFVGYGASMAFATLGVDAASAADLHIVLWWSHAIMSLALIAAFPFTRLLHSLAGAFHLALPREPLGFLPIVTLEELEATGRVGAGEVEHFSQRQLLQLDACVSCGRCEDACPAYEAGKPLSPRNVVQDIRRNLELVASARALGADGPEPAKLHGDAVSAETLWACTTCSACADVCPLGVSPVGMITDMRRHLVGEGQLSGAPAASLQKMQRSGNPWGLPASDRFAWADDLQAPTVEENPDFEYLYWIGCAASYDRRIQNVARSVVKVLNAANVSFAVLGTEERCTGESARRMGDEFLFQELAQANIETLQKHGVRKIVVHCPHCLNSFLNDYPLLDACFEVVHHSQLIADLAAAGRLPRGAGESGEIAYHDPCYLARVQTITEAPRAVIETSGAVRELPRNRRHTACCGGGGGRMWFDDKPEERSGQGRIDEIVNSGASRVAVSCPFCLIMIRDGMAARDGQVDVQDISEIYVEALGTTDTNS